MSSYQEVVALLKATKRPALLCHQSPDGDTTGSALAMKFALREKGVDAAVLLPGPLGDEYDFMPGLSEALLPGAMLTDDFDLVFSVDCADRERLGVWSYLLDKPGRTVVNIDHHVTNTRFGDVNLIDLTAAATGEIMLDLIEGAQLPVTCDVAELLYVAISTDTGGFAFSNTTPRSYVAASRLVACGLDVATVNRRLFSERSIQKTRLIAEALIGMRSYREDAVLVGVLDENAFARSGATPPDTDGVIDFLRDVRSCRICALVRVAEEGAKASLRCAPGYDVGTLAAGFGGGGHTLAAGCTLRMPLAEAERAITEAMLQAYDKAAGQAAES